MNGASTGKQMIEKLPHDELNPLTSETAGYLHQEWSISVLQPSLLVYSIILN